MIKIFQSTTFFLAIATTTHAYGCELDSYHKTLQDSSGSCRELIISAAKESNCNTEHIDTIEAKITAGDMISTIDGSATFCKLESTNGHYLIMKDDMPTLPLSTIYFSVYD